MSKKSKRKLAEAEERLAEAINHTAAAIEGMAAKSAASTDNKEFSNTSNRVPAGNGYAVLKDENKSPNRKRLITLGAICLLVVIVAVIFFTTTGIFSKKAEANAPENTETVSSAYSVEVLEKWDLPSELNEISGNAFIDDDRIACVQDNDGTIFSYNLKTKQIDGKTDFGANGDYEALVKVDSMYYVLRADGLLFEVKPKGQGQPTVTQHQLPLKLENDTESMYYDQKNNRLLIAVKEKDPVSDAYKGVYSFDLKTKKMDLTPVAKIAQSSPEQSTEAEKGKKKKGGINPSEIAVDPKTGELYVLNGPKSQFMIADSSGMITQTIQLDKNIFPQPEGLSFSPQGELYISSERAKKGTPLLAKVEIKKN